MENKKAQTIGFFVLLLIFFLLAFAILQPFFELLALSGILAFLFMPVQKFLARKLGSESAAALVTILCMLVAIGVPMYFFGRAIISEMFTFYGTYKSGGLHVSSDIAIQNLSPAWQARVVSLLGEAAVRLNSWAQDAVLNIAGTLSNVAGFFVSCFVFLFSTYYFLADHENIRTYASALFPLSASQRTLVVDRLVGAINGIVRGSFLFALMQAGAASIGFWIAGVPQFLVWGALTFFASFIPTVGSTLTIVPAIVFLLIFKSVPAAIILTTWFVVVHLPMDYLIPPRLIGSRARLHPLLVLLGVLGGISAFGVPGFIFGPIAMAIFVALVEEYRTGYGA